MAEKSILQLQRDKKILRRVNSVVAKQSLPSVLGYFLIYGVLLFSGGISTELPSLTIAVGVTLALMGIIRGWMYLRFEQHYVRGPARWRQSFVVLYLSNALVWSGFQVVVIAHYGLELNTFILVTFTVCLCAISNITWEAFQRVNKAFLCITLLPSAIAFLTLNSLHAYLFTLMLLGYFVVLWYQSAFLYGKFWETIQNTHALKDKARDLEAAVAKAAQNRDVKIDFLSNLTHEIRTPMNSVLGMLSLLGDTVLTEDQAEFQTVATHAGESLLSLIDDILDFSKISTGQFVLESSVFNLRKCIDDTLETLGPVAHNKGVELSCVYDQNIPSRVRGDAARVGQILHNLVGNAIKFSDKGEIIVEVHLKAVGQSEGMLRVHVSDHGVGVSDELKMRIFEAFTTADSSSTRKNNGTGLGLAISKGLVECMNGKMSLISKEGEGSTFWFTAMLRLSSQQAQHSIPHRALHGKRVLIVDGPEGLVRGLSNEFESWEMQAEFITGYDKALQVLRSSARESCCYDLVVLNMGLHYVGSFKLSRIIAEDPILSDTKQIILSTLIQRGSSGALKHAASIRNVLFLTKPVTRQSLYSALITLFDIEQVSKETVKKLDDARVMNPYNVLLVEDNKVNQMVAKGMLTRLGYGVKIVNNGQEALGILADKNFDIILMDCQMPILDGYETTKEIREREKSTGNHVPIVAMTANAMDGEEARCLAAGMDDYLSKPVNVSELDSKLRLWLGRKSMPDGIIRTGAGDSNSMMH